MTNTTSNIHAFLNFANITDKKLNIHSDIFKKLDDIHSEKIVNITENQPATHFKCRHPKNRHQYKELASFCDDIHAGKIKINNKKITTFCQIGIGGSITGPKAILKALSTWGTKQSLNAIFISNHDESHILSQLKETNLENTLFVIASKSGTTIEIEKAISYILERVKKKKK